MVVNFEQKMPYAPIGPWGRLGLGDPGPWDPWALGARTLGPVFYIYGSTLVLNRMTIYSDRCIFYIKNTCSDISIHEFSYYIIFHNRVMIFIFLWKHLKGVDDDPFQKVMTTNTVSIIVMISWAKLYQHVGRRWQAKRGSSQSLGPQVSFSWRSV